MIFAFILFEGILGSRRYAFDAITKTALPSTELRLSIRRNRDVGHIFTHYTSLCPFSNANRCDIRAGTLFSGERCEWLEYFEECGMDKHVLRMDRCYGFFRSRKNSWFLKWDTRNETIIDAITDLFPGVKLAFEDEKTRWRHSCLPIVWSGPETCDPVLKKGNLDSQIESLNAYFK